MASNKIFVNLQLGEDFVEEILAEMQDELDVASAKWNVHLKVEDRDLVINHSMNQLRRKVSESIKSNWDFGQNISVKVNSPKRSSDINLPDARYDESRIRLVKTREGWEIEQDISEESVALGEFFEYFKNRVKTWARTGVFYGVASFTQ